jgi:hypothetical protein
LTGTDIRQPAYVSTELRIGSPSLSYSCPYAVCGRQSGEGTSCLSTLALCCCYYHPIFSIFMLVSSGGWAVAVLWTAFLKHLTRHPSTRMEEQALYGAELVWNQATACCLAFRSFAVGVTQQRCDLTRLAYWGTFTAAATRGISRKELIKLLYFCKFRAL